MLRVAEPADVARGVAGEIRLYHEKCGRRIHVIVNPPPQLRSIACPACAMAALEDWYEKVWAHERQSLPEFTLITDDQPPETQFYLRLHADGYTFLTEDPLAGERLGS